MRVHISLRDGLGRMYVVVTHDDEVREIGPFWRHESAEDAAEALLTVFGEGYADGYADAKQPRDRRTGRFVTADVT